MLVEVVKFDILIAYLQNVKVVEHVPEIFSLHKIKIHTYQACQYLNP